MSVPPGGEPGLDECARSLGLAVEEPDAHREDLVEAPLTEVRCLELGDEELGRAGLHVLGVAPAGRLDHLRGAVERGQPAGLEPLADVAGGDTVATADLEHAVVRLDVELVDDLAQPLAHRFSFSSFSSLRSVAILRSPSLAVHSASVSITNSRAIA